MTRLSNLLGRRKDSECVRDGDLDIFGNMAHSDNEPHHHHSVHEDRATHQTLQNGSNCDLLTSYL